MRSERAAHAGSVLVVDDTPDNLALLFDLLETRGYEVRVALAGAAALETVDKRPPDLILLDAAMPGMDGFETCRRLKSRIETRAIPVIFMTGLADTEHVVQGFQAGGVDYVTKPVRLPEVLARIATHLHTARLLSETQEAADAAGDAIVALDEVGNVLWMTPLAQRWMVAVAEPGGALPAPLRRWLDQPEDGAPATFTLAAVGHRLAFSRLRRGARGSRLLVVQRNDPVADPLSLMQALKLTSREAEVLYWVALGKTNPEVANVLDMSPRTVNKHLEHVFAKLGVETRTAAVTLAHNRTRLAAGRPATQRPDSH